jgi:hypothetical protein
MVKLSSFTAVANNSIKIIPRAFTRLVNDGQQNISLKALSIFKVSAHLDVLGIIQLHTLSFERLVATKVL